MLLSNLKVERIFYRGLIEYSEQVREVELEKIQTVLILKAGHRGNAEGLILHP
jgi:hypothetical protein